jgi:hypothetical protein
MRLSISRTSLERNEWQLSRVILTVCLPSLIRCSAVPRANRLPERPAFAFLLNAEYDARE